MFERLWRLASNSAYQYYVLLTGEKGATQYCILLNRRKGCQLRGVCFHQRECRSSSPLVECLGNQCSSIRWYRLGPSLFRLVYSSGDGETVASSASWNKSLQFCPHLNGACSNVGEGSTRIRSSESNALLEVSISSCSYT